MVRARGSYPRSRQFESVHRHHHLIQRKFLSCFGSPSSSVTFSTSLLTRDPRVASSSAAAASLSWRIAGARTSGSRTPPRSASNKEIRNLIKDWPRKTKTKIRNPGIAVGVFGGRRHLIFRILDVKRLTVASGLLSLSGEVDFDRYCG